MKVTGHVGFRIDFASAFSISEMLVFVCSDDEGVACHY